MLWVFSVCKVRWLCRCCVCWCVVKGMVEMVFYEIRFLVNLFFGLVGGFEWCIEIVVMINGYEECCSFWVYLCCRYDVGMGLWLLDDVVVLIVFFEVWVG